MGIATGFEHLLRQAKADGFVNCVFMLLAAALWIAFVVTLIEKHV